MDAATLVLGVWMEAARTRGVPCCVNGFVAALARALSRGVRVAMTPLGKGLGSNSRSNKCAGSVSDSCMDDERESRPGLDESDDTGEGEGDWVS